MTVPIILGIVGAALLGAGFVVQQREAAHADASDGFSVSLVGRLMRRRVWWIGVAAMAGGYVLVGWSLGSGNLVLVEPLIASNLLFALLVAAAWARRRPMRRSILGALALAGGVAGFVAAGNPHGGRSVHIPVATWGWTGACVAGAVVGLVGWASRRDGAARAATLGAATGVLYGMQDALTRRVYGGLHDGLTPMLASWPVWTLVAVGALGVVMAQNAFDCAPLTASLPAISVGEPVVGIALGIVVFHSHVQTDVRSVCIEAASLAVMLVGAVAVSRARVVHVATAGEGVEWPRAA